jgi:hypothetical protein
MVPPAGLEPAPFRLKGGHSAIELRRHDVIYRGDRWYRGRDSNPRLRHFEGRASASCATPAGLDSRENSELLAGLEPATFGVQSRCSAGLSYRSVP